MKRRVLISVLAAVLLIVALTPAAFAAPTFDTIIEEYEVVNNDVVVLDGDLEIHAGAAVIGDVVVFNGDAFVDGYIEGDVTLFNGDLVAGADALILGECVLLNGNATGDGFRDRNSVNCTAIQSAVPLGRLGPWFRDFQTLPGDELPAAPALPEMPEVPEMPAAPVYPSVPSSRSTLGSVLAAVLGVFASSLLFGFLGLLTAAIMPNQLREIVRTARERAVVSGVAGALTGVGVPSLIILLIPVSIVLVFVCIGLLGFPIMFLLGLGLVVGLFLGWIAVGTWLGLRLFARDKNGERLVRSAALGTGLLTFVTGFLGLISYGVLGGLITFVVLCIGLGAVALTQFGMKPYPRGSRAAAPPDGPDDDKLVKVLNTLPPEEAAA